MGQIKINFDYMPDNPHSSYEQKGWKGWRNFYGNDFLSFEEAKDFVRKLKLKSLKEWQKYCKSGNKSNNIPSHPNRTYKNKWISWGDFLGTGNFRKKDFFLFEEAREFVKKLKLKNKTEWNKYCISENKLDNIPAAPNKIYRDKGWVSWGDFLGTGNITTHNKSFLSFKEARKFVRKLKLKNTKEWKEYCKSGNKPDSIPASSNEIYKNKWKGIGDFLGTGAISNQNKIFFSFEKAKIFVRKLKLKNQKEWHKYCKSGNNSSNIPFNPNQVYKDKWISWYDFLGKEKKNAN